MGVIVATTRRGSKTFKLGRYFCLDPESRKSLKDSPALTFLASLPTPDCFFRGSRVTSVSWLKIKAGLWGSTGFWLAAAGAGSG